jgi:branched-chain amino acid aminotransferase
MTDSMVNINGVVTSAADAKISVFDRGFLYGDSVYEVTQTFDHCPYMLDDHLERLWFSASRLDMPILHSRVELKKEIAKTLVKLNQAQAYLRVIISRGEGEIGLDPKLGLKNNLVIICKALADYPREWYEKGVGVIIADVLRNPIDALDPNIKSGNYLNNVMAMAEAKKRGAFDAVMLNSANEVTECTTSNIWMVKDGQILTPTMGSGILSGLTRKKILGICQAHQLNFSETVIRPVDLLAADEIFLTSTTKRIVPITLLNQLPVGDGTPGQVTKYLISLHDALVEEQKKRDQALWAPIIASIAP